ncbi:MAG: colicin V production protein [Planctomycetaceae bacterium]|nr:colicin V production protein [Planctomycetaceae bacterium]
MQTYDMIMLAVLAGATIFGFWKGLAWQVASLASLVVSFFVARRFADELAPKISEHAPWNKFLAMLIIYAGTSLAIWIVFRMVAGAIDRVKLKEFDHQMGALIGFAKGVLLCIVITFFAVSLLEGQRDAIIGSKSGQYIVAFLDKADAVAPPEIHKVIDPYIKKVEERLDPNYQPNPTQDYQDLQGLWQQQAAFETSDSSTPAWPSDQPPASNQQPAWPSNPATPAWPASTQSQ